MSDELQAMKSERDIMEARLLALNKSHVDLYQQFGKLSESFPNHVSMEEHQEALANIQGCAKLKILVQLNKDGLLIASEYAF